MESEAIGKADRYRGSGTEVDYWRVSLNGNIDHEVIKSASGNPERVARVDRKAELMVQREMKVRDLRCRAMG